MVKTSVLHDALKNINNAEKAGKRQVMIRPASKVITKFLQVMQRHGMCSSSILPLIITREEGLRGTCTDRQHSA
jgi:ribosomal protein S8